MLINVGHALTSSITTRQYDDTGAQLWTANHGGIVYGITTDPSGNIITVGAVSGGYTTRKYSPDGTLLWSANHGSTVRCVTTDADGNIYTGGQVSSSVTHRKYSPDGTLIWSANHGATVYGIAVNSAGRTYIAGAYSSGRNFVVYNTVGVRDYGLWVGDTTSVHLYGLAMLDDSTVYVVGDRQSLSGNETLWKLSVEDWSASVVWSASNHGADLLCVALDDAGDIYVGGTLSTYSHRKYSPDGTLLWSKNHGGAVKGIAAGGDGIYIIGAPYSGYSVRKYLADGTFVYSRNIGGIIGYAVSVTVPDDTETDAPGLALPVLLRLPSIGFSVRPPALAVPIALGLPGIDAPNLPPDLALLAGPYRQVYRLYLVDPSTGLTELPLASFQCRRRVGASTWLTCEIPTYSPALGAQCQDHIGLEILIEAGIDDGSGERMGVFLRAELTEVSRTWASAAGSITLESRVDNPYFTAQSRILLGVRSRGADDGRRTCTCAVDPLLRPNDEVFDGAETWTAGAILYRVGPNDAVMTVTEAL